MEQIRFNVCPECGEHLYGLYVQVQRKGILHRINPYLRYCKKCDIVYKILVVNSDVHKTVDKYCDVCGKEAFTMYGAKGRGKRYVTPNFKYCSNCDMVIRVVKEDD